MQAFKPLLLYPEPNQQYTSIGWKNNVNSACLCPMKYAGVWKMYEAVDMKKDYIKENHAGNTSS